MDAVLENVFMRLGTEWDGFSVTPSEYIDGGNQVVSIGRLGGAYKETGKSLDCDYCHVWDLRDGKAVRFRQYVVSAAFNEAMAV